MSSTINKEEIQKFSRLADEWWDLNGKFKPLHMFNPIRIEYITEKIKNHYRIDKNKTNFLNGFDVLDIGCGGGIINEPMTRLGANLTGIDASEKNINVAKLHSKKNKLKINYLNTSPEKLQIDFLLEKVRGQNINEIILATSLTTAGQTTAHYIVSKLEETNVKITTVRGLGYKLETP